MYIFLIFSINIHNAEFLLSVLVSMANYGNAQNSNSSYSLHHFVHLGMVLVSKSLDGDNYSTWCRAMVISLNANIRVKTQFNTTIANVRVDNGREFFLRFFYTRYHFPTFVHLHITTKQGCQVQT